MFIKRQKVCNFTYIIFFLLFIALVYFAQEYISLDLQSHGICILASEVLYMYYHIIIWLLDIKYPICKYVCGSNLLRKSRTH